MTANSTNDPSLGDSVELITTVPYAAPFSDDMEGNGPMGQPGYADWGAEGLWHRVDNESGVGEVVSHRYSSYNWSGEAYVPFTVCLDVVDDAGTVNSTCLSVLVFMAGDANGDGVANIQDAASVGLHWNARYGAASYHDGADLNNDDVVNILDAALTGLNWNMNAGGM